ncbi:MAG: phosphoenolpyruvate--protein phosphotransferase [Alphaproteobacteria bacterium]|nr:MAG: phosphoenolpyruvate--protein phosphotransferase [Alphaproteobacteria bacterium]
MPPSENNERILGGVGVSPGVAIGTVYVVDRRMGRVPEYMITAEDVAAERDRLGDAVAGAREQLRQLREQAGRLSGEAAEEFGYLLDAHLHMLTDSRLLRQVHNLIERKRINAEAALVSSLDQIAAEFRALSDPYMAARMQDIREVGMRLLRNLMQAPSAGFDHVAEGTIVIAEEVTPADAALMDPSRIAGFGAALGGAEGHTAIMARSLGLPAVLGVSGLLAAVRSGDRVIVDGSEGRIIVNPGEAMLADAMRRQRALALETAALARLRDQPATTVDGVSVSLKVNMELPLELDAAKAVGAAGVGLLRTEFMFMNRAEPPDETEQYETLRQLVEGMAGSPLTVRTIDVGGDKPDCAVGVDFEAGANPALGLRAIRLSLRAKKLFDTQLRAILRASAHGPVRILLPMITSLDEIRTVRDRLTDLKRELEKSGVAVADPLPPLGAMIEVPAAALSADSLSRAADFFAIGTNDLTMYTLAIDRANEQVAHLYDPMNPAVLRLVQFAAEAGRRAGIPVSVCGEVAGDERFTAFLLGLGLRELSMVPQSLPRIKRRIRHLNIRDAVTLAEHVMALADSRQIASTLDAFNRELDARIAAE